MNVLILAAGYGTRLQRGIENDQTGLYHHLKGVPKALLPIGGIALISHWVKLLTPVESVKQIVILSNERFFKCFEEWFKTERDPSKCKSRSQKDRR